MTAMLDWTARIDSVLLFRNGDPWISIRSCIDKYSVPILPLSYSSFFSAWDRLENSRGVNHRDSWYPVRLIKQAFQDEANKDLLWNKFSRWWYHYLSRGLRIKVRWILRHRNNQENIYKLHYREKWMNVLKSNILNLFRFNIYIYMIIILQSLIYVNRENYNEYL